MALRNPVKRAFERVEAYESDIPMTLKGTTTKLGILLLSTATTAFAGFWLFLLKRALPYL